MQLGIGYSALAILISFALASCSQPTSQPKVEALQTQTTTKPGVIQQTTEDGVTITIERKVELDVVSGNTQEFYENLNKKLITFNIPNKVFPSLQNIVIQSLGAESDKTITSLSLSQAHPQEGYYQIQQEVAPWPDPHVGHKAYLRIILDFSNQNNKSFDFALVPDFALVKKITGNSNNSPQTRFFARLDLNANTQKFGVFLLENTILVTEGRSLKFEVDHLHSVESKMVTFLTHYADPGSPGMSGGTISIYAHKATGILDVLMLGKNGARGADNLEPQLGLVTQKPPRAPDGKIDWEYIECLDAPVVSLPPSIELAAVNPDNLARSSYMAPGRRRCQVQTCDNSQAQGRPGLPGLKGYPGAPGLPGGDSGRFLFYTNSSPRSFGVGVINIAGKGGSGGAGGPGGKGGPGGDPGRSPLDYCAAPQPGPVGPQGPRGETGASGVDGRVLENTLIFNHSGNSEEKSL